MHRCTEARRIDHDLSPDGTALRSPRHNVCMRIAAPLAL